MILIVYIQNQGLFQKNNFLNFYKLYILSKLDELLQQNNKANCVYL